MDILEAAQIGQTLSELNLNSGARDMISRAAESLPPMVQLVFTFSVLAGIILVAQSIRIAQLASLSHERQATYARAITYLFCGTMLVNLGLALDVWNNTLLNEDFAKPSILDYTTGGDVSTQAKKMVSGIVAWIQFVGLLGFVRGWFILTKVGQRQDCTIAKALTHIIGGTLAVNITVTAKVFAATFGIKALELLIK